MSGRRVCQYLLLALCMPLLVACQAADQTMAKQRVVDWAEQNLVFIADSRIGQVRSFFLGNGAPVPFAQTQGTRRKSVRDLQLDLRRAQLWVLGDDGVSVYAARGLVLQQKIDLGTEKVSALSIAADYVLLFAESGEQIGQIDCLTRVASWRTPERRG